MLVRRSHDQRSEDAHPLVKEAHGVMLRIVAAEAVGADHFGELVSMVSRRHLTTAAHFAETNAISGLGKLPRGFRTGEAAANDVNVEHAGAVSPPRPRYPDGMRIFTIGYEGA